MSIDAPSAPERNSQTAQPSQTAAWLPWVVVAVLAAVVVATNVITDNSATAKVPEYPHHHLDDPLVPWMWVYGFPAVWVGLLIGFAIQTVRKGRFSMPALFFIAGTTMFWIEWPADWGSYLVYNKDFWLFTGWTTTWYQTYWKPVGAIFGYGIFFVAECIILLKLVPKVAGAVKRGVPRLSTIAASVLSSVGLFYVFDIVGERLMTCAGWYSYVEPVGWAWTSNRGAISWIWPALPFVLFAVFITLTLREDDKGNHPNEKFFRIHTLGPGWRREFARLAVWIVTMNVAIFIAQPLILVVGRILFLHNSVYVP